MITNTTNATIHPQDSHTHNVSGTATDAITSDRRTPAFFVVGLFNVAAFGFAPAGRGDLLRRSARRRPTTAALIRPPRGC